MVPYTNHFIYSYKTIMESDKPMYNFLILGGDSRQLYLYQIMKKLGYSAVISGCHEGISFSLEKSMESSNILLCPVPFTKDGKTIFSAKHDETIDITAFLEYLTPDHILFGGSFPPCVRDYTRKQGITCYDYMNIEEIAIENTIATAEGAIAEAIRLSPQCIHHSNCLVTGFGRCGKTLARKLKGLDAKVTAADRDPIKLAAAEASGLEELLLSELSTVISQYDFIFNTIPALIFGETLIHSMNPDAAVIDIASAPGGVDFEICQNMNIKAKLCPGLPGIYAPKAAAETLSKAILKTLL